MKKFLDAIIFGILMMYFVPMDKWTRAGYEYKLLNYKRYRPIRNIVCRIWHDEVKKYYPEIGVWSDTSNILNHPSNTKSPCPRCGRELINTKRYGLFCADVDCRIKGRIKE